MISFIDLETTGLNTDNDRIIEIGIIKFDDEFNKIDEFQSLINPGIPISSEIEEITGISQPELDNSPMIESIITDILDFLIDSTVIAGHNILKFDIPLLIKECYRCNLIFPTEKYEFIDTYTIFSLMEKRDLASALKFYKGISSETNHRAIEDAHDSFLVFSGQIDRYKETFSNINEISAFCTQSMVDFAGKFKRNSDGTIVFNFSKNIGKDVSSDHGFLRWMLNADFTEDTKQWCKKFLNE